MISEFSPAGIIGLGLPTSTILLEILFGDRPDEFVDVLPGFKLKWPQQHANKRVGPYIIVKKIPDVRFTLEGIQHQTDFRSMDIKKILLGQVSLKRLCYTPAKLTPGETTVILDQ